MRIAIVSTSYPPNVIGGAERSVQELARGLTRAGHQVRMLSLGPEGVPNVSEDDDGVDVRRFASAAFRPFSTDGKNSTRLAKVRWHLQELARLATYRFLLGQFRDFRPDVIHTNNLAGFGWLGWLAAGRIPLVHTARDYYLSCMASTHWRNGALCSPNHPACRISKVPFRFSPRRPDLFVGVSNDIIERHRSYGSVKPRERTLTIYNNPHLSAPSSGQTGTSDSGNFTFGILGRIGDDKGTWKVIEALASMPEQIAGRRIRLRIAGSGTAADLSRLETLIADDPRISYIGVSTPASFYTGVDCALVPTQWPEPFGRTAAEALIVGTPLLASNTGGLPEVVAIYGGQARLVDKFTDAASWATAMTAAAEGGLPSQSATVFPIAGDVPGQYLAAYAAAVMVGTA